MTDQLVEVEWVDSGNLFGDGWADRKDLEKHAEETMCRTAGYLVMQNDHSIYVAGSLAPDQVGSVMQIPLVAVKKKRVLK